MIRGRLLTEAFALAVVGSLCSCGGNEPTDLSGGLEVTDSVSKQFSVDAGDVGKVIDARQIFQRGYEPTSAEFTFPDHPTFDATLDVDPKTNLAILLIHNDSLSDADKTAFNDGVVAHVTIRNAVGTELASYDDNAMVLDDSNLPLAVHTSMPRVPKPLILKQGMPYLLQNEDSLGFLTSSASDFYSDTAYVPDSFRQQFYFTPVSGQPETYYIDHYGYSEGSSWNLAPVETHCYAHGSCVDARYLYLAGDAVSQPADGPATFVIEQDEDGWARIRHVGSDFYLSWNDNFTWFDATGRRFRIISDDIDWQIVDRGTNFNQPIMPPVRLDFAYSATLRNCSAATLEESVGRAETRSTTNSATTSESLQLFSSTTLSATLTLGYQVTAKVGVDVEGVGEAGVEEQYSAQLALSGSYTTSETRTSEQSFTDTETSSIEVSRVRTLTVPPNTAVEVYDAVKTVENVRVPFTQEIRITASRKSDGTPLTGSEIVSQMLFNFVGGLISTVGSDYVDVTLRGYSFIDQLMEATTDVNDLPGACGG